MLYFIALSITLGNCNLDKTKQSEIQILNSKCIKFCKFRYIFYLLKSTKKQHTSSVIALSHAFKIHKHIKFIFI